MNKEKFCIAHYDVVVVGGGLSGICAAIASARHGAKTALIQNRSVLGGNSSSEIRMHVAGANCHFGKKDFMEAGILLELQLENKKRNTYHSFPIWDSVLWEKVRYQDNLTLYLNTVLTSANAVNNEIKHITCYQMTTEKTFEFSSNIFVDATGNGTLGFMAGAEFRMGSEARTEFQEPNAPKEPTNYTMGNSIMFMASNKGEPVKFDRPFWAYHFSEEDLKLRPHGQFTWYHGKDGITEEYCNDSGYWWIELGGDSGDIIDHAEEVTEELNKVVYGIWDHLKNEGDHGAENYALDWVGSVAGIRESRRLIGDYMLKEQDILEGRVFDDAVAYGGWPMDEHAPHGVFDKDINPTRFINFPGVYTIPYRSYYSKNINNLMMTGRDISVTKMALGSTRVMGTCAIGGQAVGTAAAIAIKYNCTPREAIKYIKEIQQTLIKDDCWIPGFRNEDNKDMARTAKVTASSFKENCIPENIINGETRKINGNENCWESDKITNKTPFIKLSFEKPVSVSEARIIFDPDLSKEIMISMTTSVQEREVKFMPPQLVRDFSVSFIKSGKTILKKEIKENNQRLCIVKTDKPISADEIIVKIAKTYGSETARIYEIRVY